MCKICAEIHPKNLPKGRNFTYLEDPGMVAGVRLVVYPIKIQGFDDHPKGGWSVARFLNHQQDHPNTKPPESM